MAGMRGMIVPKGEFPHRRRAYCCDKTAKAGESVLLVPLRHDPAVDPNETLVKYIVLHRRCLSAILRQLPLDQADYDAQYEDIRSAVLATGVAFPPRKKGGRRVRS